MRTLSAVAAVMVLCLGCSASGQVTETKPGEWNYQLIPYLWMSGINGNVSVKGVDAKIDASFGELFKHFDGGFQIHFEATKDDWGYYIDPTYIKLSADGHTPRGEDVNTSFKEWLVEVAGVHKLWTHCQSDTGKTDSMYLLFGGRYWSLDADLDVGELVSKGGTQTWLDPFFGGRYMTSLSDLWTADGRLDIGGFGVGSSFTWNAAIYFGLRTAEKGSLWIGYRALNVNRKTGSGKDFFKWDVTYSGPALGYEFRF